MSKTELLNPIAKYYIIDSQFGYKQNVSLEQNRIQKLEKMFSRGEPDVLCPASGVGEGDLPPAPLSRPALSLPPCSALHCEQPAGWFWGVACVSWLDSWVIPAAQGRQLAVLAGPASWLLQQSCLSLLLSPPCTCRVPWWPWCDQPALLMCCLTLLNWLGFAGCWWGSHSSVRQWPPRSGFPKHPSKGAEARAGQGWVSWWVSGHPASWFGGVCVS